MDSYDALAVGKRFMVIFCLTFSGFAIGEHEPRPVESPRIAPSQNVQVIYTLHCSGCHLKDGSGAPGNGVPDLRKSGLYANTFIGRQYLLQVPGVSQAHLDSEVLARLLNWMLITFSSACLTDGFQPFTEVEVENFRAIPASDSPKLKQSANSFLASSECNENVRRNNYEQNH